MRNLTAVQCEALRKLGVVPFGMAQLATVFPGVSLVRIADGLIRGGFIVRLCRDKYCLSVAFGGVAPDMKVIANVLCAPSYVTAESALRHHGLIPEHVARVQSARLGRTTRFETPVGGFDYHQLPVDTFAIGQTIETSDSGTGFVCASPVKALFDLLLLRRNLNLRSKRAAREFLAEDLRIDESDWYRFASPEWDGLIAAGHKRGALAILKEVVGHAV